jgi:hypothetical protein
MEASMPTTSKEFSHYEHGMGDEDWHSLARDSETGRVFIIHKWSHRHGQTLASGIIEIDLGAFLAMDGIAQDRLRHMIGTLVTE